MGAMQRLEGLVRKAIQMYDLIQPNDVVCVGMSGGKDSVALTVALANLSRYHEVPFNVQALTLDPCFSNQQTDYSLLEEFFAKKGIPYTIKRTNIGQVVFETREEPHPCALCANLRRGALHTGALQLGSTKVALGHHLDDAVETFHMNLFGEGRIGCFAPKTWLSRKNITVIRPLVLALEQDVINAVQAENLPVVKSSCPVDGVTNRTRTKQIVAGYTAQDPAFRQKILGAMQKAGIDGWAPVNMA